MSVTTLCFFVPICYHMSFGVGNNTRKRKSLYYYEINYLDSKVVLIPLFNFP